MYLERLLCKVLTKHSGKVSGISCIGPYNNFVMSKLSQTWQGFIGHISKTLGKYIWVMYWIEWNYPSTWACCCYWYWQPLHEGHIWLRGGWSSSFHLLWPIAQGRDNIGISLHAYITQASTLLLTTFLMKTLSSNSSTHWSQSLHKLCRSLRKFSRKNDFSLQLQFVKYM